VVVVLDRGVGQVLLADLVRLHVLARRQGDAGGEGEPREVLLLGVRGLGDDRGALDGGEVVHLLRPHHHHGVVEAGEDGDAAQVQGPGAGAAGRLAAHGRGRHQAQVIGGHERDRVLVVEPAGGAVSQVERLDVAGSDAGVVQGQAAGLDDEVPQRLVVLDLVGGLADPEDADAHLGLSFSVARPGGGGARGGGGGGGGGGRGG